MHPNARLNPFQETCLEKRLPINRPLRDFEQRFQLFDRQEVGNYQLSTTEIGSEERGVIEGRFRPLLTLPSDMLPR